MYTPSLPKYKPKTPARPQQNPHGTEGYSCTLYKDYLVLYGGKEYGEIIGEVSVYNLKEKAMEHNNVRVGTGALVPRMSHSACYLKATGAVVCYGGMDDNLGLESKENLTIRFEENRDGLTWSSISGLQGPLLDSPISHSVGRQLYFYQPGQARGNFGSLYSYNFNKNDLSELPLHDNTGLKDLHIPSHHAIFSNDKLYLFAVSEGNQQKIHCEDSLLHDVYVIAPAAGNPKWEKISTGGQAPGILRNISITEADGMIYIFGSKDSQTCLWTFNTYDEQWAQIGNIGELEAGYNQRAVVYDEHLLIINWSFASQTIRIQKKALSELDLTYSQSRDNKRVCKDEPEELVQNFKSLRESNLFHDVVFEVEGEEIPAHKALLAYRSDYFMKMFASGMSESHSAKISIPNMKSHIFKAILQYIYCNEVELDEQLALDLIPLVDEYLMKGLKGLCEKYLCRQLRKDNVVDMLIVADRHDIAELKRACFRFVLKNLGSIDENEQMMKLSKPLFFELLKFQTLGSNASFKVQTKKEEQKSDFIPFQKSSGMKQTLTTIKKVDNSIEYKIDFDYGFPQYDAKPSRKRSKSPKAKKSPKTKKEEF